MMASDNSGNGQRSVKRRFRGLSRYDLVLAVIPAAFLLAGLLSQVLSVPPRATLVAATIVGTVAVVDGLFVNPPQSRSG